MNEIKNTLQKMRKVLEKPEAWCKRAPALNYLDNVVDPQSPLACRFCLDGALRRVTRVHEIRADVRIYLDRQLNGRGFISFNDDDYTTHEDVLNFLDRAIAAC